MNKYIETTFSVILTLSVIILLTTIIFYAMNQSSLEIIKNAYDYCKQPQVNFTGSYHYDTDDYGIDYNCSLVKIDYFNKFSEVMNNTQG